jgi:hypothetical protein
MFKISHMLFLLHAIAAAGRPPIGHFRHLSAAKAVAEAAAIWFFRPSELGSHLGYEGHGGHLAVA